MNLQTGVALEARPTSVRYQVLGWACALSMLTYIDRVCIKQVEPEMTQAFGLTKQQFAWVFAAFGLAYALLEVPSGWLGDRYGPRRVLCRIVLWWSVFTALTGLVWRFAIDSGYEVALPFGWFGGALPLVFDSFVLLLLIRFLFGAGEAGAYPNIARALRNWFPVTTGVLASRYHWPAESPRGTSLTSLVLSGRTPPCLAMAASWLGKGPSFTS